MVEDIGWQFCFQIFYCLQGNDVIIYLVDDYVIFQVFNIYYIVVVYVYQFFICFYKYEVGFRFVSCCCNWGSIFFVFM